MITANIFDIKRFGINDGVGIRTVIFIKGCPLRCRWCQNPEGLSREISIWYTKRLCIGCGSCVPECINGALSVEPEGGIHIENSKCTCCGRCTQVCPVCALRMDAITMGVDEVFEEIKKDEVFYRASGGGVTLSGGECTASPEFSIEILKKCREKNIDTAIESCLYVELDVLKRFVEYTDRFIVDIKLWDEQRHIDATGVSNVRILKNFEYLCQINANICVRIPLILGYIADEQNVYQIGKYIAAQKADIPIELLNFNPLCVQKYNALQWKYIPERLCVPLSENEITQLKDMLKASGTSIIK